MLTVLVLERQMQIRALVGHECHEGDAWRLFGPVRLRLRDDFAVHGRILVSGALAELPPKEGEEDDEQQQRRRQLEGPEEHDGGAPAG